jgi:hypothetical protein
MRKHTLESIRDKYCGIQHNADNYDIGGGLIRGKFASRRHEDAKEDYSLIHTDDGVVINYTSPYGEEQLYVSDKTLKAFQKETDRMSIMLDDNDPEDGYRYSQTRHWIPFAEFKQRWLPLSLTEFITWYIETLRKQLTRLELQMNSARAICGDIHGNGTMRKAKASRNWDYYAQQKLRLRQQIDQLGGVV